MNIFKVKHKHTLQPIMLSRFGRVDYCTSCDMRFTTMLEYSSGTVQTLAGNYLSILGSPLTLYVLCGTSDEFEEFCKMVNTVGNAMGINVPMHRVERLQNENQLDGLLPYHPIYLYGSWRDHDLIDSPRFMKLLNGWI